MYNMFKMRITLFSLNILRVLYYIMEGPATIVRSHTQKMFFNPLMFSAFCHRIVRPFKTFQVC